MNPSTITNNKSTFDLKYSCANFLIDYAHTSNLTFGTFNNNILFNSNIKKFQGADGIHLEDCNVNLWGNEENTIMFQSHIAGLTNQNNWNFENYSNFRNILSFLQKAHNLNFKLLKELL